MQHESNIEPGDKVNPYAPTRVGTNAPPRQGWAHATRMVGAKAITGLILLGLLPAAAIARWLDIESIVISGAVLLALSIVSIMLRGIRVISISSMVAWLVLGFVSAVFLTIFTLEWSPSDARIPIGNACVIFASLMQLAWFGRADSITKSDESE